MELLRKMNDLNRAERKKKLKIRYAVVKNRDIVQNIPKEGKEQLET